MAVRNDELSIVRTQSQARATSRQAARHGWRKACSNATASEGSFHGFSDHRPGRVRNSRCDRRRRYRPEIGDRVCGWSYPRTPNWSPTNNCFRRRSGDDGSGRCGAIRSWASRAAVDHRRGRCNPAKRTGLGAAGTVGRWRSTRRRPQARAIAGVRSRIDQAASAPTTIALDGGRLQRFAVDVMNTLRGKAATGLLAVKDSGTIVTGAPPARDYRTCASFHSLKTRPGGHRLHRRAVNAGS